MKTKDLTAAANDMQLIFNKTVPVISVQKSLFKTFREIAGSAGTIQCSIQSDDAQTVYNFLSADGVYATLHIQTL